MCASKNANRPTEKKNTFLPNVNGLIKEFSVFDTSKNSPDKIDDTLPDRQSFHCHTQTDTWILLFLSSPALFDLKMRREESTILESHLRKMNIELDRGKVISAQQQQQQQKRWHFGRFLSIFQLICFCIHEIMWSNIHLFSRKNSDTHIWACKPIGEDHFFFYFQEFEAKKKTQIDEMFQTYRKPNKHSFVNAQTWYTYRKWDQFWMACQ